MEMGINRFDVYLVTLDPTIGREIKKTRPCVVISPNDINRSMGTVIVAPMTTQIREQFPVRVSCVFEDRFAQIALDQMRAIDKKRLL